MEFTATIRSIKSDFHVQWGDAVTLRDIYSPYFTLGVFPSPSSVLRMPLLSRIRLFSLNTYLANVYDEFDEEEFLQNSAFGGMKVGSRIRIRGPVHRKLASNKGTLFRGYRYVVLRPELHGQETDAHGLIHPPVTEWLVKPKLIRIGAGPWLASRLLVAWECADLVAD